MIDSEFENFGCMWSALNSLYDIDITSDKISDDFNALQAHSLQDVQDAINTYVARSAFDKMPTVKQIKALCDYEK